MSPRCHCDDCENVGSCTAVGVGERRERERIERIIDALRSDPRQVSLGTLDKLARAIRGGDDG